MTVAELTWDQALARRAHRQRLVTRTDPAQALAVVRELSGLHAQLMSSAELTLWARVDGLARDAVATALWHDRTLVKTWAMRGTLHLLPSADYGRWVAALTARAPRAYLNRSRLRYFGVTVEQMHAIAEAIDAVLRDAPPLTRAGLAEAVERRTGSAALGAQLRESWGALLKYAAALGLLVFAGNEGQNVRFTHPAAWLDGATGASGAAVAARGSGAGATGGAGRTGRVDPAVLDAARGWLAAGGPMTREELARWWGVPPADGRRMLTALGDEVVPVALAGDGATYWMLASELEATRAADPLDGVVRLLPGFDQWTIAATKQTHAVLPSPELAGRVYRPQGWITPVLFVDGRIAGVWRHERRGATLAVTVEPFGGRLPRAVRAAVADEVDHLAAFLGREPALAWGPLD
jgi:hypothetical protein